MNDSTVLLWSKWESLYPMIFIDATGVAPEISTKETNHVR